MWEEGWLCWVGQKWEGPKGKGGGEEWKGGGGGGGGGGSVCGGE